MKTTIKDAKKTENKKFEKKLKTVGQNIHKQWVMAEKHDVAARYYVATMVQAVKDAAKFGEGAIDKLEGPSGLDRSSLYRLAAVAETWAPSDFKKVSAEKAKNGLPLSWSHWEVLAYEVKDGRARNGLMTQALDECLSVRDLRARANGTDRAEQEQQGAEPTPATDAEVIADLYNFVDTIENKLESWGIRLAGDVGVAHLKMQPAEESKLRETVNRMTKSAEKVKYLANEILVVLNACAKPMADVHELKPVVQPVLMPATAAAL